MTWLRTNFTFVSADQVVQTMLEHNRLLFAQTSLIPALRNQPCAICRIDRSKLDWAMIGYVGQVLSRHTGCIGTNVREMMEGGYVLLSHQQLDAINKKLIRASASFKEIDYEVEGKVQMDVPVPRSVPELDGGSTGSDGSVERVDTPRHPRRPLRPDSDGLEPA